MKSKIFKKALSAFLSVTMVSAMIPYTAMAKTEKAEEVLGEDIYVSSEGNDDTGNGTKEKPFATLAKAVDAADKKATTTIYVASDIEMGKCARFYNKNITVKS